MTRNPESKFFRAPVVWLLNGFYTGKQSPNPLSCGEILFSYDGKSSNVLRQTEKFAAGSYVELRTCEVPCGWTNHPACLGADIYFTDKTNSIKAILKADHSIPNARPILYDRMYSYLLDGGDERYYLLNMVSDGVARIEESNLQEILDKLESEGLSGLKKTMLTE